MLLVDALNINEGAADRLFVRRMPPDSMDRRFMAYSVQWNLSIVGLPKVSWLVRCPHSRGSFVWSHNSVLIKEVSLCSGTTPLRIPLGLPKVPQLVRCLHFRGSFVHISMGPTTVSWLKKCPYFRGVLIDNPWCLWTLWTLNFVVSVVQPSQPYSSACHFLSLCFTLCKHTLSLFRLHSYVDLHVFSLQLSTLVQVVNRWFSAFRLSRFYQVGSGGFLKSSEKTLETA